MQTVQIGKNVTKIANGGIRAHDSGEASLAAITVAEGNEYFTSYDGVLFSKDMTRLVKLPPQINLSGVFTGSATYDYTQWEVDMWYGTEGSGTRYFSDCYMIPKTVRTIDSYAFEDAVDFYTEARSSICTSLRLSTARRQTAPPRTTSTIISFRWAKTSGWICTAPYIICPMPITDIISTNTTQTIRKSPALFPAISCEKIGLASHSDYNDPNSPLVMDEYMLGYIEQYASSMVAGEGDPFVIKYSEYGTPNYVKPV